MSEEVLIDVQNVSKKYCRDLKKSLWYGVKDIAGELTGQRGGCELRNDEFWAVNDVSFQLRRGECLGLIGANGAGKSTLLKMLNGLIKPDGGQITMRGKVGALIELGAGFHPLLTGRENIYINGAVLGMSTREIDRKFDEIVDFADIGPALDAPVKSYSSGMRVRLGFAVAAHLEPDVLLIDEVLAVGDVAFRFKCYEAIAQLRSKCAVVMVSHDTTAVSRTASIGLYLNRGKSIGTQSICEALACYKSLARSAVDKPEVHASDISDLQIDVSTMPCHKGPWKQSQNIDVKVLFTSHAKADRVYVVISLIRSDGYLLAQADGSITGIYYQCKAGEKCKISYLSDPVSLSQETFYVSVTVIDQATSKRLVWSHCAHKLQGIGNPIAISPLMIDGKWQVADEVNSLKSEVSVPVNKL